MTCPQSSLQRYMREIEELELVEITRRKSGGSFTYQLQSVHPIEKRAIPLVHPNNLKAEQSGSKAGQIAEKAEAITS